MRQPRLIIANDRNRVMTTLLLDEAAAILRANLSTQFTKDLIRDYDKYRDKLNPNKKAWLLVIGTQVQERLASPKTVVPVTALGNFDKIADLFRLAGSRLKFPKIELDTADGRTVVLALAGSNSRYHGQVNVSSGHKFGDPNGRFYGRINTDGTTGVSDPGVLELLAKFAADPAEIAAEYGRRRGQCCFCRLTLTDERSLAVGYGEKCSVNYSLPYPTRQELRDAGYEARASRPELEPEPDSGEFEAAIMAAELANERVGFASDPDFRRYLAQQSRPLSFDALTEAAATSAVRDGYLPPRRERGSIEPVAPWMDND